MTTEVSRYNQETVHSGDAHNFEAIENESVTGLDEDMNTESRINTPVQKQSDEGIILETSTEEKLSGSNIQEMSRHLAPRTT